MVHLKPWLVLPLEAILLELAGRFLHWPTAKPLTMGPWKQVPEKSWITGGLRFSTTPSSDMPASGTAFTAAAARAKTETVVGICMMM